MAESRASNKGPLRADTETNKGRATEHQNGGGNHRTCLGRARVCLCVYMLFVRLRELLPHCLLEENHKVNTVNR